MPAAPPVTCRVPILQLESTAVAITELLGIDPFDQPADEECRSLAHEYCQR